MGVGERVHAARIKRSMSLSDLARATHLSKGFISQVERGKSNPSLESLRRLAEALDLAPGAFLDASLRQSASPPTLEEMASPIESGSREIAVHSFEPGSRQRGNQVMPILADPAQGTSALITIMPHSMVFTHNSSQLGRGTVICAVLLGTVTIRRGGVVAVVEQGKIATFDAGESFELTNSTGARATILLTVPPGCSLPKSIASRGPEAHRPVYSTGPLRLVEMRASRSLAGEQRR